MKLVTPQTYLIGATEIDFTGLRAYCEDTDNMEFFDNAISLASGLIESDDKDDIIKTTEPIPSGLILCSFYAKLCYKSLKVGDNANISKVRDIVDNIQSTLDSRHGSVFEHCQLNFVIRNCSRILTHELVRHRVGTAFSQTSGRYVAIDDISLVLPPFFDEEDINKAHEVVGRIEDFCRYLRKKHIEDNNVNTFAEKKAITSAIRRFAPNGQANEIGLSVNIRSIRHILELRSNEGSEWEIRMVANQIINILMSTYSELAMYAKNAKIGVVDGFLKVSGIRV
jgi:thymidylate synthase (FAD)